MRALIDRFPSGPWLFAAAAAALPWVAPYLPCQDLAYHLATLRILHDFHNPTFGFDADYQLTLGRTNYLAFYVVGSALATVFGVVGAVKVLMSAYLAGTFLALRSLAKALGRDPRTAVLSLSLLVNPLFLLGLLPFLTAVPLMIWALACASRHFEAPRLTSGVWLACVAVVLSAAHIVPFGLFLGGAAALFPWRHPRSWLASAWPIAPGLLSLGAWLFLTDAGAQFRDIAEGGGSGRVPFAKALQDLYGWIGNTFRDSTDEVLFGAASIIVILLVLPLGRRPPEDRSARVAAGARPAGGYGFVPWACVLLYFVASKEHGTIWPISQRFAVLAALTALPLVTIPDGVIGRRLVAAASAVGLATIANAAVHFVLFQRREVGPFETALAHIEPRRHVAALIFDKQSRIVWGSPFLHFGSYAQVAHGGVVQHSFAGYNHWPVDFLPGHYPPPGGPVRPGWEWAPEHVPVGELYPFYDYVLTRGPGFTPPAEAFELLSRDGPWSVWRRVETTPARPSVVPSR